MKRLKFGGVVLSAVCGSVLGMEFDFDRSTVFPSDYHMPFGDGETSPSVKKVEINIPKTPRKVRKSAVDSLAESSAEFVQKVSAESNSENIADIVYKDRVRTIFYLLQVSVDPNHLAKLYGISASQIQAIATSYKLKNTEE